MIVEKCKEIDAYLATKSITFLQMYMFIGVISLVTFAMSGNILSLIGVPFFLLAAVRLG